MSERAGLIGLIRPIRNGLGPVLELRLGQTHWERPMNRMVSNALKTIQSAASEAFTEGISAATVGRIVRLLIESRHGDP